MELPGRFQAERVRTTSICPAGATVRRHLPNPTATIAPLHSPKGQRATGREAAAATPLPPPPPLTAPAASRCHGNAPQAEMLELVQYERQNSNGGQRRFWSEPAQKSRKRKTQQRQKEEARTKSRPFHAFLFDFCCLLTGSWCFLDLSGSDQPGLPG